MAGFCFDHLVDQPILQRLVRGHEKVAISVFRDLFYRLVTVISHKLIQGCLCKQNFLRSAMTGFKNGEK